MAQRGQQRTVLTVKSYGAARAILVLSMVRDPIEARDSGGLNLLRLSTLVIIGPLVRRSRALNGARQFWCKVKSQ